MLDHRGICRLVNFVRTAVECFREAAVLPERWPHALDLMAEHLKSDGATLLLTPTRPHLVASSTSLAPFIQQHFALPFPDPREQRVCPGVGDGFMPDHAFFSSREIDEDPYYQEFLVPRGFGWNAAAELGDGLLLSVKRGAKRGPYDDTELATLNSVLPWLRAASRVACMTWRSTLSSQLSVLERIDRGAILIDEQARVLDLNACIELGDGLDISGGLLQATRPADRQRLQRYLAAILDPDRRPSRGSSTLTISRPSGMRPWLLDAIGCTDALRSLHSRAAALVLITDIERPARLKRDLLRDMFGLTATEAGLACQLVTGRSLQQAAAILNISEGHARQRLKAIFGKTDTARQVELVALLAKLS
jgi:DNA-binding CsgD family transcriptional regulator